MWCWKKVRREQPESPRRAPVPGLAVVRKSKIFVMTRERSSLEPRSSLRCGASGARVPGPHLALSVLQVSTAPQPCPSPGRGTEAAPGRADAERSGRVIRAGRRESGEVWGVNRERREAPTKGRGLRTSERGAKRPVSAFHRASDAVPGVLVSEANEGSGELALLVSA